MLKTVVGFQHIIGFSLSLSMFFLRIEIDTVLLMQMNTSIPNK